MGPGSEKGDGVRRADDRISRGSGGPLRCESLSVKGIGWAHGLPVEEVEWAR